MTGPARAGALVRVACDTLLIPLRVLCAGIDGAAVAHRAALSSPAPLPLRPTHRQGSHMIAENLPVAAYLLLLVAGLLLDGPWAYLMAGVGFLGLLWLR